MRVIKSPPILHREDAPKGVPKENGKAGSAGSALSYAAIAADSTAAQQPPDTSAASEASQAAEQPAANEASAPIAAAKEEETPSVAAGASAATEHKSSGSRQSKSGLRQPLVWLDLEMTGGSLHHLSREDDLETPLSKLSLRNDDSKPDSHWKSLPCTLGVSKDSSHVVLGSRI